MKNSYVTKKGNTLAALVLVLLLPAALSAQQPVRLGFGVECHSSGNSHGSFISPYAGYEWGKHFMSAGPMIHKRSGMIRGGRAIYSYNLSGQGDRYNPAADGRFHYDLIQLNFYVHAQYNASLPLAFNVVEEQSRVSRQGDIDWSKTNLSTAEVGFGFEARVNLTRHITWRNTFGIATHYHTKYVKEMTRNRCMPSLALGTGILFMLD